MRRSHHKVAVPALVVCQCGAANVPHAVCPACGNYRKRNFTAAENQ